MTPIILGAEQHWVCPNCTTTAVTHEAKPHTEFHHCAGAVGMWMPMVTDGTRCKIEALERDDFVGDEIVRTNGENRPIMAAVTTRDDGQDCAVFAPTATLGAAAWR